MAKVTAKAIPFVTRVSIRLLLLSQLISTTRAFIRHSKAHQDHRQQLRTSDLSPDQVEQVKQALLAKMGMDEVPRHSAQFHVPDYLWDVYRRLASPSAAPGRANLPLPPAATDVVRTFLPASSGIEFLPSARMRVGFNLSHGFPADEELRKAFVRLCLNRSESESRRALRLNFYEVTRPGITRQLDTKVLIPTLRSDNSSAFDSADHNSSNFKDWIAFDASPAISRRLSLPAGSLDMLQFEIQVQFASPEAPSHETSEQLFGMGAMFEEEAWEVMDNQPVLIYYGKDLNAAAATQEWSEPHSRVKRRSGRGRKKGGRRRKPRPEEIQRSRQLCRRVPIFVDFRELGWNSWIIAPPGYEAFLCAGACQYPNLDRSLNPTNHAVIQAMVNSARPDLVPPPCCVPTKTTHISILYNDIYDRTVVKNYPDMSVEECGCR